MTSLLEMRNDESGPWGWPGLIVQDNAKKRAIYLQTSVVVDEPKLSEFVHEKIHS